MMKLEDMRKIAEARESMGVMNVSREARGIYLDFVMLSEKTYLKLLTVAEAVKFICRYQDSSGTNIGEYRHLDNGDVSVDGDRWETVTKALEELERE